MARVSQGPGASLSALLHGGFSAAGAAALSVVVWPAAAWWVVPASVLAVATLRLFHPAILRLQARLLERHAQLRAFLYGGVVCGAALEDGARSGSQLAPLGNRRAAAFRLVRCGASVSTLFWLRPANTREDVSHDTESS